MTSIYITTNDPELSGSLQNFLCRAGFAAAVFEEPEVLLDQNSKPIPECILAGAYRPGSETITLISAVKVKWPNTPVIVVAKEAELSHAVKTLQAGAFDYLEAPVIDRILLASLQDAIAHLRQLQ